MRKHATAAVSSLNNSVQHSMISRNIPSTNELVPVIGIGTWQTFDVNGNETYPVLTGILDEMHTNGGRLIDTSPMYGQAEKVIGDITSPMDTGNDFFYATKVWTSGKEQGIRQMEASFAKLKRNTIDLMQIHNLVDWKIHMATLRQWKDEGRIRYIGITHYTDDMHEELEKVLRSEPIDFVQFNYSIQSTHAEKRILPAAADLGVATLINRPFGTGKIFHLVQDKQLPEWAASYDIKSWAGYFLKYIISHPAVTCVIPATSDPEHAAANFQAGSGMLPDANARKTMLAYFNNV